MEDDIEIKQQYLCKEIIEKNYNPEEFLEFIQSVRGEEASLDTFSMKDLKIVKRLMKNDKIFFLSNLDCCSIYCENKWREVWRDALLQGINVLE